MTKFYLAIVQAVLLYGADTWVVSERDMGKLRSFHWRAIRYMTGCHIRKRGGEGGEGDWEYPNHKELMVKCKLLPIETYVERRRGTLRKYLEENRADVLAEAGKMGKHNKNVNKIMWWNQNFITKNEMNQVKNFWFK